MERLGGSVTKCVRSDRHTMTRACVAKGMSAEVCVSDTGFIQLLLES